MKKGILLLLLPLTCLAVSLVQARTWTNQAGHSLEAELVDVKGGQVILKQPGGDAQIEVTISDLSEQDQTFIKAWQEQQSLAEAKIPSALKGNLVRHEGSELVETELPPRPLYAFYYSASWCGPCRKFTPELVRFYRRLDDDELAKVEFVFVSRDKSKAAMEEYMDDDRMEWPALSWETLQKPHAVFDYNGPGIPCLTLVDASGKVVSNSYVGDRYRGPHAVLEDLEDWLDEQE